MKYSRLFRNLAIYFELLLAAALFSGKPRQISLFADNRSFPHRRGKSRPVARLTAMDILDIRSKCLSIAWLIGTVAVCFVLLPSALSHINSPFMVV